MDREGGVCDVHEASDRHDGHAHEAPLVRKYRVVFRVEVQLNGVVVQNGNVGVVQIEL